MRVSRIYCTACGHAALIRKTNRKHRELADIYCACSNVECGHTFVMNLSFSHTLSPSAIDCGHAYKAFIDTVKPEDREAIIDMLKRADEADKITQSHQESLPEVTVIRRGSAL